MTFIEQYDNVLTPEFCNKAIEYFNFASQHNYTKTRQEHDNARKLDKDGSVLFLPESFPLEHTSGDLMKEFSNALWASCYTPYSHKYSILRDMGGHSCYGMKIQKIEAGEGYHVWHCETFNRTDSSRLLGWIAYLNDDFEAGETEFLYQQVRITPKQGTIMLSPAGFTHVHRGNPPINGTKYIITGWIEF
jgi:hypothetical protein